MQLYKSYIALCIYSLLRFASAYGVRSSTMISRPGSACGRQGFLFRAAPPLPPVPTTSTTTATTASSTETKKSDDDSKPFYKKWWFYGIIFGIIAIILIAVAFLAMK